MKRQGAAHPRSERARKAILKALAESGGPAGAARIASALAARGMDLKPRSVRFHLLELDRLGATRYVSRRRGRELTERGRAELARGDVLEKMGFVASRVDDLGFRMDFDRRSGRGQVIVNVAQVAEGDLARALHNMEPVFRARLGMGGRLAFATRGERIGDYIVPPGFVAFGTVCSVALNGILLKAGIPVTSRFGGLVELSGGRPARLVDLIEYRGTTMDPLELFIRAGLTRVLATARSGSGVIGVSFREIPNAALREVQHIHQELKRHDFTAILDFGRPNQPLLDVPVAEGRTGMLVIGGLNAFAALRETGIPFTLIPMAGLADYDTFEPFHDVAFRGHDESHLID